MQHETWSRGCGSGGVGYSGHVNTFRSGVAYGNFVEDAARRENPGSCISHLGWDPSAPLTSTQRASYHPYGKTGPELRETSHRHDGASEIGGDVITRHGSFLEPPVHCLGSTYQFTHGNSMPDRGKTQTYLWHGTKKNDLQVPHAATSLSLTQQKRQAWNAAAGESPYGSTWRAATHSSALAVAEAPAGSRTRTTLRPAADGGQPDQPGRRPVGDCASEVDKNYRKMGLRKTYA